MFDPVFSVPNPSADKTEPWGKLHVLSFLCIAREVFFFLAECM
ncbi:unnamed protein product [Staurois parvus]|uniref:Uncharacterized protein n=1 Tax=Staurois parvus TaxID=386267 RepID=A0ABN9AIF8_9NEOB|nr:unnamed protein product [Staurois parvus]